jgi:hypothetical protein
VEEEDRKEDDQVEEGKSVVCGIHFVWFVFSNSNMMAELTERVTMVGIGRKGFNFVESW